AGQEHLQCALTADVSAQGDHGCRAEEAYLDAGRGEPGPLGSDCEIAAGDELASCRAGNALHSRDYRLRDALDLLHHPGADFEDLLFLFQRAVNELLEVVAGGEGGAVGTQDHYPDLGPRALSLQLIGQLLHERRRQGVALLRPVERDEHRRKRILDLQISQLYSHGYLIPRAGDLRRSLFRLRPGQRTRPQDAFRADRRWLRM